MLLLPVKWFAILFLPGRGSKHCSSKPSELKHYFFQPAEIFVELLLFPSRMFSLARTGVCRKIFLRSNLPPSYVIYFTDPSPSVCSTS